MLYGVINFDNNGNADELTNWDGTKNEVMACKSSSLVAVMESISNFKCTGLVCEVPVIFFQPLRIYSSILLPRFATKSI